MKKKVKSTQANQVVMMLVVGVIAIAAVMTVSRLVLHGKQDVDIGQGMALNFGSSKEAKPEQKGVFSGITSGVSNAADPCATNDSQSLAIAERGQLSGVSGQAALDRLKAKINAAANETKLGGVRLTQTLGSGVQGDKYDYLLIYRMTPKNKSQDFILSLKRYGLNAMIQHGAGGC